MPRRGGVTAYLIDVRVHGTKLGVDKLLEAFWAIEVDAINREYVRPLILLKTIHLNSDRSEDTSRHSPSIATIFTLSPGRKTAGSEVRAFQNSLR